MTAFNLPASPSAGAIVSKSTYGDPVRESLLHLKEMSYDNLLVNPGFEHWFKGAGPYTTDGIAVCPGWYLTYSTGANEVTTHQVDQFTPSDDPYSYSAAKVTYTAGSVASNAFVNLHQLVEDYRQFKGEIVTFAMDCYVELGATSVARVQLSDGVTVTNGAWNAVTTQYERLSVSATVSASATELRVICQTIRAATLSCNTYWDNGTLIAGNYVPSYQPLPWEVDYVRCLRRMQVFGGVSDYDALLGYGYVPNNEYIYHVVPLAPAMGGQPTVTLNGTWAVTNCAAPTVHKKSHQFVLLRAQNNSGGTAVCGFSPNGSDDTLVAEWTP